MKKTKHFKGLRIFRNAENILRTKKVCQPTPSEAVNKKASRPKTQVAADFAQYEVHESGLKPQTPNHQVVAAIQTSVAIILLFCCRYLDSFIDMYHVLQHQTHCHQPGLEGMTIKRSSN